MAYTVRLIGISADKEINHVEYHKFNDRVQAVKYTFGKILEARATVDNVWEIISNDTKKDVRVGYRITRDLFVEIIKDKDWSDINPNSQEFESILKSDYI